VQRYYCKRCGRRFRDEIAFGGIRNKVSTVVTALDLYYRGLSLRQIAQHLESCKGIKVSHGTVYNWIRRFVSLISQYLRNLQIATSERWHADETLIKVRGRHLVLWALMDSETRYLIALHISKNRGAEDAKALIKKAIETSENKPLELVTDGAKSYEAALEKSLPETDVDGPLIHLRGPLTASLNNKMERFFRTIKGRLKTIYQIHDEQTAQTFADGFYIYYNFIKVHRAIEGRTPAQATGLLKKRLSWLDLIRKASSKPSCKRPDTLLSC
jgi:transposase-like protein